MVTYDPVTADTRGRLGTMHKPVCILCHSLCHQHRQLLIKH